MNYDVAVIGSGPGGYIAAIRSSQLGLSTVCIEKEASLGGTCLNIGCIPSKTLLYTTASYEKMKEQGDALGIETTGLHLHFEKMMQRKEAVVKGLADGVKALFKQNKVDTIYGKAFLKSAHEIVVDSQTIHAQHIILATGSESIPLPFLPFDEKTILSSTGALALDKPPKSLLVIGAGVIGVELASVYRRLGTEVILIEMLDHICGNLDETIHKHYLTLLKKQGLDIRLKTQVLEAYFEKGQVHLKIEGGEHLQSEKVLVSIGRRPFAEGLNLEEIGVARNSKGFVVVDGAFKTTIPSIYAIGDLIEGPMLAHRASEEGVCVAESIAGNPSSVDYMSIPNVIYTDPEMASVGLTEQEAKALLKKVISGTCFMKANARARCMDDTDGLVKVIADAATHKLVGVHILASHASEWIGPASVAIQERMDLEAVAAIPFAHPTLSEALKEAVLNCMPHDN